MGYNPKDHFFKKAKSEDYLARSVYKLQEIDEKHKLIRKNDIMHSACAKKHRAMAPGATGKLKSNAVCAPTIHVKITAHVGRPKRESIPVAYHGLRIV